MRENWAIADGPFQHNAASIRFEGMRKIMDSFNNHTLTAVGAYFPFPLMLSARATPVSGYSNAKLCNTSHVVRKTT
jgi:hypothetical protein